MRRNTWQDKSAVIVEHEANEIGPGHTLERYLLEHQISRLRYIGHPNLYIRKGFSRSSRTIVIQKRRRMQASARFWKLPEWCLYIKDCFYTFGWVISDRRSYDVYIGLGNMNALCGVLLKKLGIVKYVIYYVIDYVPKRFHNPILNTIYTYAERVAALWSDRTWNLSSRMIEARNKRWNMQFPHQRVVPHGLYLGDINVPRGHQNPYELIYMGNLNKEQGVQLAITSLTEIVRRIPKITLTIIGTGNYESELKRLTKDLRLSRRVHFLGSIPDDSSMVDRLRKAAIAVAMYTPDHAFAMYTDPGKIKYYISAGLPVIMTGTPQIAGVIDQYAGYTIPYDVRAFVTAASHLVNNRRLYERFRRNALELAKGYDWTVIFDRAFRNIRD